jgi:hypothetical protein
MRAHSADSLRFGLCLAVSLGLLLVFILSLH